MVADHQPHESGISRESKREKYPLAISVAYLSMANDTWKTESIFICKYQDKLDKYHYP